MITDITPTHFIPKAATKDFATCMEYLAVAEKLHVSVVLQMEIGQPMGDLIEIFLPSVQIWPYAKAPRQYQLEDDDADWCVFVPVFLRNKIDIHTDLESLSICGFSGPYSVPDGEVWIGTHS